MLRTWHNCESKMRAQGTRWKRGRSGETNCNQQLYGAYMGAVDRAEHYCTSYSFTRKTLRWWRKFFLANGGVCGKFFHPLQESNRTGKTQALGIQGKPLLQQKNQKQ